MVPYPPVPQPTSVSCCHHRKLGVSIRDALELELLRMAPLSHELAAGLDLVFRTRTRHTARGKSSLRKGDVDLKDELDVGGGMDEVEDSLAAFLLDLQHVWP